MNHSFHSDRLAICQPLDWTPAQIEDAMQQLENTIDLATHHGEPKDYLERLHYHLSYLNHQKRMARKTPQS